MFYKYVDIGTADFETSISLINSEDEKIILVEPLLHYLNRFPNQKNIYKAPFALSDKDGISQIYFVSEETIMLNEYPFWAKGCNSINEPHPTLLSFIPIKNFEMANVPVLSVSNFINLYQIEHIGQLKIDTEGHDHIILKEFLNCQKNNNLVIDKIIVEYIPVFKNTDTLDNLFEEYKKEFNANIFLTGDNVTLTL